MDRLDSLGGNGIPNGLLRA